MLRVIRNLFRTSSLSFANRFFHCRRSLVCVHHHLAIHVAGCSSDHLNERCLAPQKSFFIGIQNRYKGNLRQVETLSQQIDSDKDIKFAESKIAQYLDALNGVNIGVQISHFQPLLDEILAQIFRHFLGERSNQDSVTYRDLLVDHGDDVIDLTLGWAHNHFGVDKASRPHNLFDNLLTGLKLEWRWCCG